MQFNFDGWGFLVSLPLLGALACSGEQLYDVGNLTSGGGGTGGSDAQPSKVGSGGQQAKGGSRAVATADAGAPAGGEPAVPAEGGTAGVGGDGDGGMGGEPQGPCAPGINLLRNGSFDELTLGFPTDWNRYGTPAELVTLDAANGSDGQNSLKLELPDSWEYWARQRVSSTCIVAGELLRVTGYYRASRADSGIEIAITVGDEYLYLRPPAVANEWLPFSVDVAAPSKAFRVDLWSVGPESKQAMTLWYDDVALVRVPE